MKIREATERDSDRVKEIAERSFRASYALSPLDIETVVESEFEHEPLVSRLDDDSRHLLVAVEKDGENSVLGFAEGRIRNDKSGEITWLHVDPQERGNGAGTELFKRVLADLREYTPEEIRGVVLTENQEGGQFFERFEFESHDERDREFDDRMLHEEIYRSTETVSAEDDWDDEEYTVPEDTEITVDGETRYIGPEESISAEEAEMLPVFEDEDREEQFGFYCTNCGTFTSSPGGLGTIVCENCGNEHRPEDWDESYL